jgi:hypothetical protein
LTAKWHHFNVAALRKQGSGDYHSMGSAVTVTRMSPNKDNFVKSREMVSFCNSQNKLK